LLIKLKYIVLLLMLASAQSLLCDDDDDKARVPPYTITVTGDINLGVYVQGWSSPIFPPDNSIMFTIKLNRKKPINIILDNSGSKTGKTEDVKITTEWMVNNGNQISQLTGSRHYKLTNVIYVTVTITNIQVARYAQSGPRRFEQVLEVDMCF